MLEYVLGGIMESKDQKPPSEPKINLELVFKVIENRGYQRMKNIPSMNSLIYEKVKHLYVNSPKR